MTFYVFAASLCLATVILLGLALIRRRGGATDTSQDMAIYRHQLAELERDTARGVITPEEEAAARVEIERRLIAASRRGKASITSPSRLLSLMALLLIGLVPLACAMIYLRLGNPTMIEKRDFSAEASEVLEIITEAPGKTKAVIRRLTRELQNDINNPGKWVTLGRALYAEGRKLEALPAYETAVRLTQANDPLIFAEYTQVLRETLEERLEANPDDVNAWRQLADMHMTVGDIDAAQVAYAEVLRLAPDDVQARGALGVDAFSRQN